MRNCALLIQVDKAENVQEIYEKQYKITHVCSFVDSISQIIYWECQKSGNMYPKRLQI
jgi:hypothetical protein